MAKQQHRFLKIIGITPTEAYEKYNIPPIDTYIEKTCINIVERILKDPNHPLTQAQDQLPKPHHFTRNAHIRLNQAKTAAYEYSCLQAVLKLKRDGYKDKYTKPRRKEATKIEYNLKRRTTQNGYKLDQLSNNKTRTKPHAKYATRNSRNEASNNTSPSSINNSSFLFIHTFYQIYSFYLFLCTLFVFTYLSIFLNNFKFNLPILNCCNIKCQCNLPLCLWHQIDFFLNK
jgi:hypothetical protein